MGIRILRAGYVYRIHQRVRIRPSNSAVAGHRSQATSVSSVGARSAILAWRGLAVRIYHRSRARLESVSVYLFCYADSTLPVAGFGGRSEEHTSELQSLRHL